MSFELSTKLSTTLSTRQWPVFTMNAHIRDCKYLWRLIPTYLGRCLEFDPVKLQKQREHEDQVKSLVSFNYHSVSNNLPHEC